jgi:hypothetical protein
MRKAEILKKILKKTLTLVIRRPFCVLDSDFIFYVILTDSAVSTRTLDMKEDHFGANIS